MRTSLITGASRGIGKATAEKFLAEGWRVIGTSTSGSIDTNSKNLIKISLDLGSSSSIAQASRKILSLEGNIDVLVNNAGISLDFNDTTLDSDKLRKTLEVNLIGLADFTERLLAQNKISNGGHIINISSEAGAITSEIIGGYMPAYKISKAGLNMYTQNLAERLKPHSIKVSSLDPTWVKTDMGGQEAPGKPADSAADIYNLAINKNIPTGRFWREGEERNW